MNHDSWFMNGLSFWIFMFHIYVSVYSMREIMKMFHTSFCKKKNIRKCVNCWLCDSNDSFFFFKRNTVYLNLRKAFFAGFHSWPMIMILFIQYNRYICSQIQWTCIKSTRVCRSRIKIFKYSTCVRLKIVKFETSKMFYLLTTPPPSLNTNSLQRWLLSVSTHNISISIRVLKYRSVHQIHFRLLYRNYGNSSDTSING